MILVNKADGDLIPAARRTTADYAGALRLLRKRPQDPEGFPKATMLSALEGTGLSEAWADIQALAAARKAACTFSHTRNRQRISWFHEELEAALADALQSRAPSLRHRLEKDVEAARITPRAAAQTLLNTLLKD
ncbi:MAG: hypothetical protein AAFY59_19070 [Pseudomonadota bacterium]